MRILSRKSKRILWTFCLISLLCGGYYLFLSIFCNILNCSSSDNKNTPTPYAEDFVDKEKGVICSHLQLRDKPNTFKVTTSPQLGIHGPYSVVYNYIKSESNYKGNESVTYSTHTTTNFIKHTKELAYRWNGPISVAVYVPSYDFCSAVTQILRLRQCGEHFIRKRVSWHIYWHENSPPPVDWWKVDQEPLMNCTVEPILPLISWRNLKGLHYPVNVGRNVARKASRTWFVLASDIELYPSKDLPRQFMSFIGNDNFTKKSNIRKVWPRIYIIPVFEVQNKIPETKEELLAQISQGEAVYFHRHVCPHCQKIPGLSTWLQRLGTKNQIHAFSSVKRYFPYHRWEPIYIGTNNEPLYDERLSWEGLQDKMSQMHELCLRDYNLVILDRAFLVHSPGIKKKEGKRSGSQDEWRKFFIHENSKTYDIIMNELQNKLGNNVKCRRH